MKRVAYTFTALLPILLLTSCDQRSKDSDAPPAAPAASPHNGETPTPAQAPATAPAPVDRMTVHAVADKAAFQPQAATISGEALTSTGKPGFLLFGPYATIAAGRYRVTVQGGVSNPGSEPMIVDVASKGKVFAEQKVSSATPGTTIASLEFELPTQTENVEFRARVGQGAVARVTGYTLEPIQ
jgi:hypothetical protein